MLSTLPTDVGSQRSQEFPPTIYAPRAPVGSQWRALKKSTDGMLFAMYWRSNIRNGGQVRLHHDPVTSNLVTFWAGKVRSQKQTILKVGKKEYRTRSIKGLTIHECEKILSDLLSGNFRLARGSKK